MSNLGVNNELKSLEEVFNEVEHIFQIPDYQRGYSWENQQRKDLLTDIEYVIKSGFDYRHYTGTIVASLNQEETDKRNGQYIVFEVVDGQQRLTSLILLLSTICDKLKKEGNSKSHFNHDEIRNKFIYTENNGNTLFKLKLNKDDHAIFKNITSEKERNLNKEESESTKSTKNLVDGKNQFTDWLHKTEISIDKILHCVCESLGFLLYAPKKSKEIGIMFEVINNRGKSITELEKLKNYFIYFAEKNNVNDIKEEVERVWPSILKDLNKIGHINNESEDQYLRNCWITYKDVNKSRSHHVYDSLKKVWPPESKDNHYEILDFIGFLNNASETYCKVWGPKYDSSSEEKSEAEVLNRISFHPTCASITPLLLAIFARASEECRGDLLDIVEKLNFRYYLTGIAGRADSGQGELFSLAHNYFNNHNKDNEGERIDDFWLKQKLTRFVGKKGNNEKLVKYLTLDLDESGDYYDWVALKFFLASYEEHLRNTEKKSFDIGELLKSKEEVGKDTNDFYDKEHIWAIGDTSKGIDESSGLHINKRRLGNFMLLNKGLNPN